jgi:hypothetical protein
VTSLPALATKPNDSNRGKSSWPREARPDLPRECAWEDSNLRPAA